MSAGIDQFLAYTGILAEGLCSIALLQRSKVSKLPLVTCYLVITTLSEITGNVIYLFENFEIYWHAYIAVSILGYVAELAALKELAYRAYETKRATTPSRVVKFIGALFVSCSVGVAISIASFVKYRGLDIDARAFLHFDLGFAIFRVLALTAILALAGIAGLHWNNLITKVAVGFSFYAVFALLAEIAHEYEALRPYQFSGYALIERLRIVSWCLTMFYLTWQVLSVRNNEGQMAARNQHMQISGLIGD